MEPAAENEYPKENEFIVEQIMDRRRRNGFTEYLLKWKGYPHSENTWEREGKLNCPGLIQAFENRRKQKTSKNDAPKRKRSILVKTSVSKNNSIVKKNSTKSKNSKTPTSQEEPVETVKNRTPNTYPKLKTKKSVSLFNELYIKPEKIFGATEETGELMFLVKWPNSNEYDFVSSRRANSQWPQEVIKFYEERLTWEPLAKRNCSVCGYAKD